MAQGRTRVFQIEADGPGPSPGDASPVGTGSALAAPLDHPLVLDLDHTLLRTDLLFESFAAALRRNPLVVLMAILWLIQGKAVLKRRLCEAAPLATDLLPVNPAVVALAEAEFAAGRRVVLATAADELFARRIAARFPFIDDVLASNGRRNLKGATKAALLKAHYPGGFVYAGDHGSDLAIWAEASEAVAIGPSRPLARRLEALGKPTTVVASEPAGFRTALRAMRLKQWVKNGLVFAPVGLAGLALSPGAWLQAMLAFAALGLVASATYLVNDIVDLEDDRRHWSKRERPLASGAMRLDLGLRLAAGSAALGFLLASLAGPAVAAVLALYTAVTLAYSLRLKRIPILDVATLAGLFTLRLFLGVVAIGAVISPWLFVFSMALFLSLSIAKRHTEVVRAVLHGSAKSGGRGYVARDEPLLLALGLSAGAAAIVLFSLYLTAEAFRIAAYTMPGFLWATPFVLFLWLGRIWLLSQRGELDDDPVAFAIRDRVSLSLGAVLALAFAAAMFGGRLI